ncbi:MAG: methyltransferase domain-containing protein [Acidobacteriia bacterium]|nr:methyltransferase domain-containing protein [Terriglobia bacterium]
MTSRQSREIWRTAILAAVDTKIVLILIIWLTLGLVTTGQTGAPPRARQIFPEHTPRDEWQKPVEIIEALDLKPGDTVADIGAGAGYFTGWLSQAVGPQGQVYAADISEEAIRLLNEKIGYYPIKNIKPVLCTESDLKLPPQSLDLAFLLNTFSVVKDKETMLANVMTALKDRGRLTIIDWNAGKNGPPGPPRDERLSEERVIKMAEQTGFRLVRHHEMLPSQYFLEFAKNGRRRNTALK